MKILASQPLEFDASPPPSPPTHRSVCVGGGGATRCLKSAPNQFDVKEGELLERMYPALLISRRVESRPDLVNYLQVAWECSLRVSRMPGKNSLYHIANVFPPRRSVASSMNSR